ncbi:MAG: hypothetical protein JW811_08760 [Clostridiales bacterium]|nr:hypothetical protein [Clostridiales bacterium]
MRMKFRRFLSFAGLLVFCVFCLSHAVSATAVALPSGENVGVQIVDTATEIGDNYVRYPQLDGLQTLAVQQAINDAIVEEAAIAQRLITLSTLQPGGAGLQVSYTAYLQDSLLSAVINAKGTMENLRSGQKYTALAYDLQTGARLQMKDFFTDPDAAVAWMEARLQSSLEDELSNYLEHADITPLPVDSFAFDSCGITFYYPYQQFALLSGYSAAVQFLYGELQAFLISNEGSVPSRLGALLPQYTDAQIKERIETIVSQGTLPCIPVKLGDSIPDLIADYRLTRTPDQFPGGRYFQFEAPVFREVLILSDALTAGYDASVAEGILATRMNLYGIQTGVTMQTRWREILGEPVSVYLDTSTAVDYGLPAGTADYYTISNRQLMLYADETGVLYAVRIHK